MYKSVVLLSVVNCGDSVAEHVSPNTNKHFMDEPNDVFAKSKKLGAVLCEKRECRKCDV